MTAPPLDTDIDHFVERYGPMSGREIDAIGDGPTAPGGDSA